MNPAPAAGVGRPRRRWTPARWLPGSIASRVFLLYVLSWLFCVAFGVAVFYRSEWEDRIETTQQSAQMLLEVSAQTVSESAVIGDYDTIKRILDTATHDSVFRRAVFIDLSGGQVSSESAAAPRGLSGPPEWLRARVGARLYDVNRNIVAGGRDYGVLRMVFDADRVAREFWAFGISALAIGMLSFLGGLAIIWWPLRLWLRPLQFAAQPPEQVSGDLPPEIDAAQIEAAPQEFRRTLQTLAATATRLRSELAEREAALQSLRSILATLHPAGQESAGTSDLGELVSSLSRLVRERESMREDLARAVLASDAASRAKSAFLATMSHELRTPLNGILGMAQLLHLGELDAARRQEYSGIIHSAGVSLLALLNDILDLSKIEAGKLELAEAEFSPAALLLESANMFSASASAKGLALTVGPIALRRAAYWADAGRLRQMLSNLVNNAIKFTPKGTITLACAEISTRTGHLLEFSVADTGEGIAPEQLGRLFQRFSQLDDSNTRRAGGSGLGLSIVRGLAEAMGGEAGVETRPGAGARFWIRIPAVAPTSANSAASYRAEANGLASQVPARFSGRVLVADDSPANRLVAERLLERLGLTVLSVQDGREAVAAAMAEPAPDLVLMDLQMPDMDGIEATREIRAREAAAGRRRVPIIALTAAAYATDHDRSVSAGMDGHLAKPILLASLAREVGNWLPAQPANAAPSALDAAAPPVGPA